MKTKFRGIGTFISKGILAFPTSQGHCHGDRISKRTSAANSVLISPIPLSPTRNIICRRHSMPALSVWIHVSSTDWCLQTFENRLFSIFWAIANFKASGSVLSRMFLCLICTSFYNTYKMSEHNITLWNEYNRTKPGELHILSWTGTFPIFWC